MMFAVLVFTLVLTFCNLACAAANSYATDALRKKLQSELFLLQKRVYSLEDSKNKMKKKR